METSGSAGSTLNGNQHSVGRAGFGGGNDDKAGSSAIGPGAPRFLACRAGRHLSAGATGTRQLRPEETLVVATAPDAVRQPEAGRTLMPAPICPNTSHCYNFSLLAPLNECSNFLVDGLVQPSVLAHQTVETLVRSGAADTDRGWRRLLTPPQVYDRNPGVIPASIQEEVRFDVEMNGSSGHSLGDAKSFHCHYQVRHSNSPSFYAVPVVANRRLDCAHQGTFGPGWRTGMTDHTARMKFNRAGFVQGGTSRLKASNLANSLFKKLVSLRCHLPFGCTSLTKQKSSADPGDHTGNECGEKRLVAIEPKLDAASRSTNESLSRLKLGGCAGVSHPRDSHKNCEQDRGSDDRKEGHRPGSRAHLIPLKVSGSCAVSVRSTTRVSAALVHVRAA